jgi:catechol 2,3-dioxygenase
MGKIPSEDAAERLEEEAMVERVISQLAHVELLTPKLEESARFFTDVLGLDESGRDDGSIYLRCWGDFFFHSVQLTTAEQPGLGHIGWRAEGQAQLERAVEALEASGVGDGWSEDQRGHGRAFRYRGPGGHVQELFWEVERYEAPAGERSAFPARPRRFSPRGVSPRQLDHVTVVTANPVGDSEWYRDTLGYRFMELTGLDDNPDLIVFAMVTTNEKSHDLGLVVDFSGVPGRVHHLAFWVDAVEDVLRAADALMESGVQIEFGPGRHGMGEQTYLYFREPGGLRLEINSGGYRNYQPDWQPVKWVPSQGSNTMYRNLSMPDSMLEAFPPAAPTEPLEPAVANPWAQGAAH